MVLDDGSLFVGCICEKKMSGNGMIIFFQGGILIGNFGNSFLDGHYNFYYQNHLLVLEFYKGNFNDLVFVSINNQWYKVQIQTKQKTIQNDFLLHQKNSIENFCQNQNEIKEKLKIKYKNQLIECSWQISENKRFLCKANYISNLFLAGIEQNNTEFEQYKSFHGIKKFQQNIKIGNFDQNFNDSQIFFQYALNDSNMYKYTENHKNTQNIQKIHHIYQQSIQSQIEKVQCNLFECLYKIFIELKNSFDIDLCMQIEQKDLETLQIKNDNENDFIKNLQTLKQQKFMSYLQLPESFYKNYFEINHEVQNEKRKDYTCNCQIFKINQNDLCNCKSQQKSKRQIKILISNLQELQQNVLNKQGPQDQITIQNTITNSQTLDCFSFQQKTQQNFSDHKKKQTNDNINQTQSSINIVSKFDNQILSKKSDSNKDLLEKTVDYNKVIEMYRKIQKYEWQQRKQNYQQNIDHLVTIKPKPKTQKNQNSPKINLQKQQKVLKRCESQREHHIIDIDFKEQLEQFKDTTNPQTWQLLQKVVYLSSENDQRLIFKTFLQQIFYQQNDENQLKSFQEEFGLRQNSQINLDLKCVYQIKDYMQSFKKFNLLENTLVVLKKLNDTQDSFNSFFASLDVVEFWDLFQILLAICKFEGIQVQKNFPKSFEFIIETQQNKNNKLLLNLFLTLFKQQYLEIIVQQIQELYNQKTLLFLKQANSLRQFIQSCIQQQLYYVSYSFVCEFYKIDIKMDQNLINVQKLYQFEQQKFIQDVQNICQEKSVQKNDLSGYHNLISEQSNSLQKQVQKNKKINLQQESIVFNRPTCLNKSQSQKKQKSLRKKRQNKDYSQNLNYTQLKTSKSILKHKTNTNKGSCKSFLVINLHKLQQSKFFEVEKRLKKMKSMQRGIFLEKQKSSTNQKMNKKQKHQKITLSKSKENYQKETKSFMQKKKLSCELFKQKKFSRGFQTSTNMQKFVKNF